MENMQSTASTSHPCTPHASDYTYTFIYTTYPKQKNRFNYFPNKKTKPNNQKNRVRAARFRESDFGMSFVFSFWVWRERERSELKLVNGGRYGVARSCTYIQRLRGVWSVRTRLCRRVNPKLAVNRQFPPP